MCLGTASCYPTPARGVSCTALQHDDGSVWLFDCGEGSQIQLQRSTIKPGRIRKIFVTHLHGDHLYGLPGLLCSLANGLEPEKAQTTTVELYGPVGIRKYVQTTLGLSRSPLAFTLAITEMEPRPDQFPPDWGDWPIDQELTEPPLPQEASYRRVRSSPGPGAGGWHLLQEGGWRVEAAALKHRIPSFGFLLSEAPSPGRLDSGKLLDIGIKPGPIYGKLKAGQEVEWEGKVLRPSDFLGQEVPGRRVAVCGDTSDSRELVELVGEAGLDLLCHEATMENSLREKCVSCGHSTPAMAAQVAVQCSSRHLLLFHLSPRYKPVSGSSEGDLDSARVIQAEAEEALRSLGREDMLLTVAEDFTEVTLAKKKP